MASAKQQKAAESYKQHIQARAPEIVEVRVPSGFVFQFKKPGVFGTLFGIGTLPQTASSGAVDEWVKQGILKVGEQEGEISVDTAKYLNVGMAVVDRVLHLSYKPKLVSGPAKNEDELSTDDVDEEDLTYLFKWVSSGGDLSATLDTFPNGSKPNPLASASRKKQRHSSKRAGAN